VATSPSSRTLSKNSYSSVQILDGRAAIFCRLDYYVRPDSEISLLFVRIIVPTRSVDGGLYLLAVFVIVAIPFLVAQFNYERQNFWKAEGGNSVGHR